MIGLTFVDNRTRLDRALGPEGALVPVTGVTNRVREITAYGEASVALFPWLTATAGARYTHSSLSGEGEDVSPLLAAAFRAVTAGRHENALLPSFAIAATPAAGLTLYARYQEGFRPGGLAIEGDFVRRFRSDHVSAVEAGMRLGVPGRDRFDFAASVSRTWWKDIQADFIDAGGLPSTANIGDGRIWSITATAGWRAAPACASMRAWSSTTAR